MTRNEQYWIDRADRRMDSYTLSAIAQASIINQSYNQLCNYVQSEIAKILRHIGDEGTLAYEYRMKRLTDLLERTNKRMQELYGVTLGDTTEFLRSIIPEAYYHTIFDIAQGTGYQPMFSAVNNRLIDQIVNDQWSGMNYSQRIWWNTDKLAVDTRQILTTAAMTGESIYKTSRRLSERFGQSMNNSVRLIRTETTYSCNQAELASYSALDIDRYKFVATLDTRTSSICQELDGKVFETKDAKAGVNLPAMHPNCRSTTIAYFEDGMPQYRIARDKDGNRIRVPADMTYKDWYKNYIENGSQSPPTPARGNNTPKPSGKPQQPTVKPTEGNAVDINVSEPVNPPGAYTDVPIPENNIDKYPNSDIIEVEGNAEIPKKIVDDVNAAVDKVSVDFPIINEQLEPINYGDTKTALGENGLLHNKFINLIRLSSDYFSDYSLLKAKLLEDFNNEVSYKTNNAGSLVCHEIGHALHKILAMKRVGIKYGEALTPIKQQLFENEFKKITIDVYNNVFDDSFTTPNAIFDECAKQLGNMARNPNELIAQSFGNYYYGDERMPIAEKIVEFFKKELM